MDYSENWRNLSNSNVQFTTLNGVKCAYFNWNAFLYLNNNPITWNSSFTAISWFYNTTRSGSWQNTIAFWNMNSTYAFSTWINSSPQWSLMVWWWTNDRNTWFTVPLNEWICCAMIHQNWTIKTYVNWTLVNTSSVSYNLQNVKTRIWCWLNSDLDRFTWYIWRCIEETVARSETEYLKFYNKTKKFYWL